MKRDSKCSEVLFDDGDFLRELKIDKCGAVCDPVLVILSAHSERDMFKHLAPIAGK